MELLVTIAVLAIIAGAATIGIVRAAFEQRFRSEAAVVVDQLRLAQDLMLILNTDVHVKFGPSKEKDSIEFWLTVERELPESIKREFVEKKQLLKTIKGVFFHDQLEESAVKDQLDIKFQSKGIVMSRGVMRLATSDQENPPDNVLQTYICLAGYPRPISSMDDKKKAEALFAFLENPQFDAELTQATLSKLPEKKEKKEAEESDDK
jgi:type II secretory pathway pseudopilin PulG